MLEDKQANNPEIHYYILCKWACVFMNVWCVCVNTKTVFVERFCVMVCFCEYVFDRVCVGVSKKNSMCVCV